jgi:selenium-binding protein 1
MCACAGNFVRIDARTFTIADVWAATSTAFGYDYWYQPYHNVMLSTSWGAPNKIKNGFNLADVQAGASTHVCRV